MAEITVATFDQIATILSKLATNYSNLFIDYETLFYSDTPADVTIQIYNAEGELETFTIPNRAKDRRYILNGDGSPEGVVSASKGTIYQDLTNGSLYLKQVGTDSQGWYIILSEAQLSEKLRIGDSSPEGVETATLGTLYVDKANGALYIKTTSTGNTGWKLISASTSLLASIDLDNLSDDGEAHFANPSLSNLNTVGQALIDSKENVNNKVTTLSSSSTNTQYPSAKVVYDNLASLNNTLATRELDNLTATGEEHFLGKPQMRDCILYASNGLLTSTGNVVSIPAGTILLGADGINSNYTNKLTRKVVSTSLSASSSYTSAERAVVFFRFTKGTLADSLVFCQEGAYSRTNVAPTGYATMVWYNPDTNVYKMTTNSGSTWTDYVMTEVARFTTDDTGSISTFTTYHPVVVATQDDLSKEKALLSSLIATAQTTADSAQETATSVSERVYFKSSYVSGTSGYVVFSDGFKIQWGRQATYAQYSTHTITLLLSYSNSNFTVASSTNYVQTAGDWTSTYALYPSGNNTLYLNSRQSQSNTTVTWITMGY